MLLRQSKFKRLVYQFLDGVLSILALWLAYVLRTGPIQTFFDSEPFAFIGWTPELGMISEWNEFLLFVPILLIVTPICLSRLRMYHLTLSQRPGYVLNLISQAGILIFLILLLVQFLFREYPSRTVLVFFVPCFIGFIAMRHLASVQYRYQLLKKGIGFKCLIVVTDRPGETDWPRVLEEHPEYGFQLAQEIDLSQFSLPEFVESLHQHSAHLVIFDLTGGDIKLVNDGIRACEDEGIEAWFSTNFIETRHAKTKVDYFNETPLLIFRSTPDSSWSLMFKDVFDRSIATLSIIILSPLFIILTLVIKISSPGPVFFRQQRSGLFGHPFVMYKFRSMVTDAEQRKSELEVVNEMSGPVFKVTNDPRITPIGHWLRRTSLDELPQLFNVVKGEMSLVGPRPLPVYETKAISENAQRRRLSVKPGITCLWQISGRNSVADFKEWVRLDLEYIDNWSTFLDFKILLLTIPVVLFGNGAK